MMVFSYVNLLHISFTARQIFNLKKRNKILNHYIFINLLLIVIIDDKE